MAAKKTVKPAAKHAAKQSHAHSFPKGVSQPAIRALASIGVARTDQLTSYRESEIASLHGMGPKALGILKDELHAIGKSFKR